MAVLPKLAVPASHILPLPSVCEEIRGFDDIYRGELSTSKTIFHEPSNHSSSILRSRSNPFLEPTSTMQ